MLTTSHKNTSLYFLGIGGTGMGSLAIALKNAGYAVSGSDNALYPPMSTVLEEHQIAYTQGYGLASIETAHKAGKADIVVVGNAISRGNPEIEYVLNERLTMISMSEAILQFLITSNTSIVITGTHGKTTTTALCAWMFEHAGKQPGYFIGGVPGNFTEGCRASGIQQGFFVSEGDEYDTVFYDKRSKFMHYRPDIAVINNIEMDHADIYSSVEEIKKSFRHLVSIIPQKGLILAHADQDHVRDVVAKAQARVETFGVEQHAFWKAVNINYATEGTEFTVVRDSQKFGRFSIPIQGEFNVRNALAVIAIGSHSGLSVEEIQQGIATYRLPKRRMEEIGTWRSATVIDDFAHHPTAIKETIKGIIQKYEGRRLIVVFEPRTNTTTRNIFQDQLAHSFGGAHTVIIGPTNRPERYTDAERLSIPKLMSDLEAQSIRGYAVDQSLANEKWGDSVVELLGTFIQPNDVIAVMSNGSVGGLREMLTQF
jgi:UDP-N-acetylmuramate: L-alanyl-gamma-D-glutamyl-meso-diaminopimelate ligase